jgi:hypothetical protein
MSKPAQPVLWFHSGTQESDGMEKKRLDVRQRRGSPADALVKGEYFFDKGGARENFRPPKLTKGTIFAWVFCWLHIGGVYGLAA